MGLFSAFDGIVGALARAAGTPPDHLKVIVLLLISIPGSYVFTQFRGTSLHVISIVVSTLYIAGFQHMYWGYAQLAQLAVTTYVLCSWGVELQRKSKNKQGKVGGIRWPWLVMFATMGQLTLNHIYRYVMNTPLTTIEITGSMMVAVQKLSWLAWNLYDGQLPDEGLSSLQLQDRIKDVPDTLSFLGYTLFFPSVLAGPAFSFAHYSKWARGELMQSETANEKSKGPAELPATRFAAAQARAIIGLVALVVFAAAGGPAGYHRMLEDNFKQRGFFSRLVFTNIAGFVARTKYYAVWCFAEAACIVSGLGYDPSKSTYTATRNVNIGEIELAGNWKVLLDNWNVNTNAWLRSAVYIRLARPGKKPGFKSTMITFATSALWHGVNAAYMFTFILGGFYQALCRLLRSSIRPFFIQPAPAGLVTGSDAPPRTPLKFFYDVLSIVALQCSLNYTVIPFILMDVRPTLLAWYRLGFYGHVICLVPFAALSLGGGQMLRAEIKRRQGKPQLQKVDRENEQQAKDSAAQQIPPTMPEAADELAKKEL